MYLWEMIQRKAIRPLLASCSPRNYKARNCKAWSSDNRLWVCQVFLKYTPTISCSCISKHTEEERSRGKSIPKFEARNWKQLTNSWAKWLQSRGAGTWRMNPQQRRSKREEWKALRESEKQKQQRESMWTPHVVIDRIWWFWLNFTGSMLGNSWQRW